MGKFQLSKAGATSTLELMRRVMCVGRESAPPEPHELICREKKFNLKKNIYFMVSVTTLSISDFSSYVPAHSF